MKALSETVQKLWQMLIFFFKVGHRSRSEVKLFCMSGKPLSQGTYMLNIKALSQTVQKFLLIKSQVQVKVTDQKFLYEWEALVRRNLHAKYEGSTWNGSKVMTKVNFFFKVSHRSRSQVKFFLYKWEALATRNLHANLSNWKGSKVIRLRSFFLLSRSLVKSRSQVKLFFFLYEFVCLCWGFTAQSTQWGHVERGQFT